MPTTKEFMDLCQLNRQFDAQDDAAWLASIVEKQAMDCARVATLADTGRDFNDFASPNTCETASGTRSGAATCLEKEAAR